MLFTYVKLESTQLVYCYLVEEPGNCNKVLFIVTDVIVCTFCNEFVQRQKKSLNAASDNGNCF